MLVDSHAHLEVIDDLEGTLDRAKDAGVSKILAIGASIETSKRAVEISDKLSTDDLAIYAAVGIHPKDGRADVEKFGLLRCFETLKQIAGSSNRVVAIGECGLDYYLGSRGPSMGLRASQGLETSEKERSFQRELFEGQIKLAADLGLPLIIHCRNAWDDVFKLLTINHKLLPNRGVFHSWTGDWEVAQKALGLGFYISFSGIVTFKNAREIQEVAKKAPLERILIETDSPYLSPEPFRGRKNEPKNVKITAQFLAKIRGLPFAKIADVTTGNAEKLFRL